MKFLFQVAYFYTVQISVVYSSCPSNGISSTEACYWAVPAGKESDVLNSCESIGGTLAIIPNQSVLDFLIANYGTTLSTSPDNFIGFYIGVNDKVSEGHFMNYEGENQLWTNWASGEPNDDNSPPQDCVRLVAVYSYKWTDTSCDDSASGLCYFKYTTTTVPSETTMSDSDTTVTSDEVLNVQTTLEITSDRTTDDHTTTLISTDKTTTETAEITTTNSVTESTTSSHRITTTESRDITTSDTTDSRDMKTTTETMPRSTLLNIITTDSTSGTHQGTNQSDECVCVCYTTQPTLNTVELQEKIRKIVEELTIPKKETSQNRRKLISAADYRTSAISIGYVGATILILVCSFIVGIDALNLCKSLKNKD